MSSNNNKNLFAEPKSHIYTFIKKHLLNLRYRKVLECCFEERKEIKYK